MALDYIKRERGLEWRHLVDALQRRSGGGTQRVYAVVDLGRGVHAGGQAPPRGAPAARAEEVRARDGAAWLLLEEGAELTTVQRASSTPDRRPRTSHDEHAVQPQRRPQPAADEASPPALAPSR